MKDLGELKQEATAAMDGGVERGGVDEVKAREALRARELARSTRSNALVMTGIIAGSVIALNVAFYFLSTVYFADKRAGIAAAALDPNHIASVRFAFAIFSGSIAAGMIASLYTPKWVGHGLSIAAGLTAVVASIYAFRKGLPSALPVALFVVGALYPVLVWRSLARSRAAWSFLIAMCFSLALILIFGAPKIRAQVGIGLWLALVIPGMLVVAGSALVRVRDQYRDL